MELNMREQGLEDESGKSFASLEDELLKAREKEASNFAKNKKLTATREIEENGGDFRDPEDVKVPQSGELTKSKEAAKIAKDNDEPKPLGKKFSLVVATPVEESQEMVFATVMGESSDNSSKSAPQPVESKRKKYMIWGAILLLIVAGAVVVLVFVTGGDNSSTGANSEAPTPVATSSPTLASSLTPAPAPLVSITEFVTSSEEPDALPATFLLLQAGGLLEELDDLSRNFTLFAIHGSAIISVEATAFTQRLFRQEWTGHTRSLLRGHIVEGDPIYLQDFDGQSVTTQEGIELLLTPDPEPMVNNVTFQFADVQQLNGVIHAVNSILCPEWCNQTILDVLRTRPNVTTMLSLLEASSTWATRLSEEQGPFTLFVPTDEAFAQFYNASGELEALRETQLLAYLVTASNFAVIHHDLLRPNDPDFVTLQTQEGSDLQIDFRTNETILNNNEATVTVGDVLARNGYVHIIDRVVVPPGF